MLMAPRGRRPISASTATMSETESSAPVPVPVSVPVRVPSMSVVAATAVDVDAAAPSSSRLFSCRSCYASARARHAWLPPMSICFLLIVVLIVGLLIVIPVTITQTRNQTTTTTSKTSHTTSTTYHPTSKAGPPQQRGQAQAGARARATPSSPSSSSPSSVGPVKKTSNPSENNSIPTKERPVIRHVYDHDAKAFTQGLEYYDGNFFESTGYYSDSRVRVVNVTTGQVLVDRPLPPIQPPYFGEGLTRLGDLVYQLTWQHKIGFIYNLSLDLQRNFPISTDGWGLANDGTSLILSDGSEKLYWIEPTTFSITKTVLVTKYNGQSRVLVKNINELEYIAGYVYANLWYTDIVVVIDPSTGYVVKEIWLDQVRAAAGVSDAAVGQGAVCNGIAWDGVFRMYFTGKWWPKLVECDLILPNTAPTPASTRKPTTAPPVRRRN